MKKLFVIMALVMVITLGALYVNQMKSPSTMSAMAAGEFSMRSDHAAAVGTFVQTWLVRNWDDERWLEELKIMREAGMEYLVLAPAAVRKQDEKSGKMKLWTFYPTRNKDFKTVDGGKSYDIVDMCLRNAQKFGIKVFLGLNFSDEWWTKRLDTGWVFDRMEEGNQVADELWELYRSKYPDAFYGWYWCWEVDNANFRFFDLLDSKKLLADAIRMQLDHFEHTGKRLPFMLAPFIDWKLSTPGGFAGMWRYVFENSGMKAGDVFAPQDSIGAGGLTLDNYMKWFAGLRRAVDSKPGIHLWANIETFDIKDWTAAALDRFVKQMNDLKPYSDGQITFSYSHYYSPNIVHSGFHQTYLDYLKTGSLEVEKPGTPAGFQVEMQDGGRAVLSWNPSSDNIGVCGYYVFRNNKKIANLQVKRKDGHGSKPDADTFMADTGLKSGKSYQYEVQAYDFAGNVSEKAGPVSVTAR